MWIPTPPVGRARMNDETWKACLRQRLLMPQAAVTKHHDLSQARQCAHHKISANTTCPTILDEEGVHERICGAGGGITRRHNGGRQWLANKYRAMTPAKVAEEKCGQPWTSNTHQHRPKPEGLIEKARIDIIVQDNEIELFDFVVATVACNDRDELMRRTREPGRAARQVVEGKRTRYGGHVTAFAIEDTGRLHPQAAMVLRQLAGGASDPDGEYNMLVA